MRKTPPFRADHVGGLLRPKELLAARDAFRAGRIFADAPMVDEEIARVTMVADIAREVWG